MKILMVTAEDPGKVVGGLGVFIREIVTELRKRHDVRIVFTDSVKKAEKDTTPPSSWVNYYLGPSRSFPAINNEAGILDIAQGVNHRAWQIINEFKPDIIHINERNTLMPFRFFPNVVFSMHLLFSDLMGLKFLDDYWHTEHKIERVATKIAKAYIVYSPFMRDRVLKSITEIVSPIVLPLGCYWDRLLPQKNGEIIRIAYFGRFNQMHKGQDEFIKAVEFFPKHLKKKYNIEFNLFGKPDFGPDKKVKNFTRTGFLSGQDLEQALTETDIVVMPSKYEPFGLTGLEALASGCVLVAPEGLGMSAYAIPGQGFYPCESDAQAIYCAILDLVSKKDFLRAQQYLARKSVESWTWEKSAKAHEEIYHQVVTGRIINRNASSSGFADRLVGWRNRDRKEIFSTIKVPVSMKSRITGRVLYLGSETDRITIKKLWGEVEIFAGPCEFLPFEDDSFNSVFATNWLEFQGNFSLAISEMARVCKKDLLIGIGVGHYHLHQITAFQSSVQIEVAIKKNLPQFEVEVLDRTNKTAWFKFRKPPRNEFANEVIKSQLQF